MGMEKRRREWTSVRVSPLPPSLSHIGEERTFFFFLQKMGENGVLSLPVGTPLERSGSGFFCQKRVPFFKKGKCR